ncbi:MAG: family 31 glucosidase, partial [Oscillospiraceae bacterium]|nr:family 31 glucosidase [Oscillospiraceae bacterium]
MGIFFENNRLIIRNGNSQVWIEPWGESSLRIRMTAEPQMDTNDWALSEAVAETEAVYRQETVDTTDPWDKSDSFKHYHQT